MTESRTIVVTRETVLRAEGMVPRFTVTTRTITDFAPGLYTTKHATVADAVSNVQAREALETLGTTIAQARDLVNIASLVGLAVL